MPLAQRAGPSSSLSARVGVDLITMLHGIACAVPPGLVVLVLWQSNSKRLLAQALMEQVQARTDGVPQLPADVVIVQERTGEQLRPVEQVLADVMQQAAAGKRVLLYSVYG